MDRRKRRGAAASRVLGVVLLVAAYAALLTWASEISAVDAASSVRDAVVTAGTTASSQVQTATAATARTLEGAPREAPLTTLAIAGVLVLATGGWYAVRSLRNRAPLARRRARLIVRYLTALI